MSFIVLRKQRDNDTPRVSELVRRAYTSNITNIFLGTLFNETTFQLMIIFIAILFIFFQVPFLYCILAAPGVLLVIYLYIYATVVMKSAQVMYDKKPIQSWVAEVYEPYFHNKNPENCWYKIIQEDELEGMEEPPKGRKKLVGTIAVMKHLNQPEWAWLYRVVVDTRYRRKGVALELVKTAQVWCKDRQINRIELALTEYNQGARQLFDKSGFEIKQLYHKKQLFNVYMLQMFLLSTEVRPTFN